MARIDPLAPKAWPLDMRESLAPLSPDGRRHLPPPRDDPSHGVEALGLLAHYPALAKAFLTFNGHVLWDTSLKPRQRQLLILRVAARRSVTYVWSEHCRISRHAGLTDEEIERVRSAPDSPMWSPFESALLRAADELLDDSVIAEGTWSTLAESLEVPQLMDVVFTVGCYGTISSLYRTVGLEGRSD